MRSLLKFLTLLVSIVIVGIGLMVAFSPSDFNTAAIFGTLVGAFVCALVMAALGKNNLPEDK